MKWLFGLVDSNPNVALLIVIVFAHFTPGLIAITIEIFSKTHGLYYTNQFIQVFLLPFLSQLHNVF